VHVELNPSGASRDHNVTRLLSNPRRKPETLEANWTMPDDAKKRLRKSLQSRLRQTLLRLVTVLDTSEVGTSRLLAVPLSHFHTLVPGSKVEALACAEQWTTLLEALDDRKEVASRRQSGILQYEPNLRLQTLSTVVHRPAESVLLKCTECGLPMWSSWYFVHPRTGVTQVLMPQNGHADCRRLHNRLCLFRSEDKRSCFPDNFHSLRFCEHNTRRRDCVACGGAGCCIHGRRRYRCSLCDNLVKRRKRS